MEDKDLTNVELFFIGKLMWDELDANEQRRVRDALQYEEESGFD